MTIWRGEIIEKKTNAMVSCIADQYLLEFGFSSFKTLPKSELESESKRIGRLIPPYITRIQKSFSSYMIREGVPAIPEELFDL